MVPENMAGAFELFDSGQGPVEVVKRMKLDPRAARALHREWVDLRGGFFVGAEALAKLEGIAFLRDLLPVTNGEELVRMLEACEVEQCTSCRRRVPGFCGWCVIVRLPGGGEMARREDNSIRHALTSVISPHLIRRRATKLRAVKRSRKVDIVALVYTLVLGFDRGAKRTVASLRRAYAMSTETTLAPSAFYDRFTPALAELMRELTAHAFEHLSRGKTKLHGALSAFVKVAIADEVRRALRRDVPRTRVRSVLTPARGSAHFPC